MSHAGIRGFGYMGWENPRHFMVYIYVPKPMKMCGQDQGQILHCLSLQVSLSCFLFLLPSWDIRRRQWQPTPVPLPGKSHGRRSLVGCSPWGRKESDMTERLPFHFSLSCIGGNGNPLQCSCLENPRDGGAWWAAVYGILPARALEWVAILFSRVAPMCP